MGIAVHTGVGHGAIRPSGRSVQPNGLADFAFVHAGQYGTSEGNFLGDSVQVTTSYPIFIEGVFTADSGQSQTTNFTHTDAFTFGDSAVQTSGGYPSYTDTAFNLNDGVSGAGLTLGTHSDDIAVESVFGNYRRDAATDSFTPIDNPSQNISYNATRTETAPLTDGPASRKDGSQETLPLTDSGVKT